MKFEFLGSFGQKVQIGKGQKFKAQISQKVQIFGERKRKMKCGIFFGCFSTGI